MEYFVSTVASSLTSVEKKFTAILTPHHIILYGALAIALFVGVYFFQGTRVKAAEGREAVATAVAAQAKQDAVESAKSNATLQAALALQVSQLQDANKTLAAANATLAGAMKAEVAALAEQRKVDTTLTPTEQSQRWTALVPDAKSVTPTSTGFALDAASGLATIQALEQLPVDAKRIEQLTTLVQNDDSTIANDSIILAKEQQAHTADVANDVKQLIASKAETVKVQSDFDTYKKKAHRNIMRAFAAGVVTGVVVRKFLGF